MGLHVYSCNELRFDSYVHIRFISNSTVDYDENGIDQIHLIYIVFDIV